MIRQQRKPIKNVSSSKPCLSLIFQGVLEHKCTTRFIPFRNKGAGLCTSRQSFMAVGHWEVGKEEHNCPGISGQNGSGRERIVLWKKVKV